MRDLSADLDRALQDKNKEAIVSLNAQRADIASALSTRAKKREWDAVKIIVEALSEKSVFIPFGALLFEAIEDNKPDVVRFLILHKINIYLVRESDGLMAIQYASFLGHWDCVEVFCSFDNINPEDARYGTVLFDAARAKRGDIVYKLLEKNCRSFKHYSRDGKKYTAVHWAIEHNDLAMLQRLLEAGAPANSKNNPPLQLAYFKKNISAMVMLAKHGADLERALPSAALCRDWETIRGVLDGLPAPSINLMGKLLFSAIDQDNTEMLHYLLSRNANANVLNNDFGYTPVEYASLQGKWNCVAVFLNFPHIDPIAARYGAAACLAAGAENWGMVEKMLPFRPDLNYVNFRKNRTVLLCTLERKNLDMLEKLLKNGADPNFEHRDCLSALEYAELRSEQEAINILRSYGARIKPASEQNQSKTSCQDLISIANSYANVFGKEVNKQASSRGINTASFWAENQSKYREVLRQKFSPVMRDSQVEEFIQEARRTAILSGLSKTN